MKEEEAEVSDDVTKARSERHLDKGWSWVVLGATFISFFIMQGQLLTGNIYFIIYLREFGEPRSVTAFTGAAYTAAVNLTGPLSSILLKKYGPRFLLMTGGFIMSSGFLCIYPAQTIALVIFASGIIRGIGASFIMTGCQAALSKYFCKRLYLATGLMYSASAIGMMTVGLMTEYVVDSYGWRGSLIIQAGLTLHICLCGALVFKIPKSKTVDQKITEDLEEQQREKTMSNGQTTAIADPEKVVVPQRDAKTVANGREINTEDQDTITDGETSFVPERETDDQEMITDRAVAAIPRKRGMDKTMINGQEKTVADQSLIKRNGTSSAVASTANNRKSSPRQYMSDARFWCISGCTTMLFMFTSVVVIFWKDILPRKEHFKIAVVSMALGSTLGRATAGLVSSRVAPPLHNCAVASCNAVIISGFLVCDSLWTVAAHNFAWGFFNGQQTVADRLQLAWVFGRLDMAIVLGYSLIFVGIGGFMAPPLAGFITDLTGNYSGTLIMTSSFSAMGAILSLFLYFIHKKRLKQAEEEARNKEEERVELKV